MWYCLLYCNVFMLEVTMQRTSSDIVSKVAGTELFARKAGTGPVKLL